MKTTPQLSLLLLVIGAVILSACGTGSDGARSEDADWWCGGDYTYVSLGLIYEGKRDGPREQLSVWEARQVMQLIDGGYARLIESKLSDDREFCYQTFEVEGLVEGTSYHKIVSFMSMTRD